jgi:hypothetical protein
MSSQKKSHHTSKVIGKSDNLHSLQKSIVLCLAQNEPKTINQIKEAVDKGYRPTHTSIKSLVRKKLITKTGARDYRGQHFPCYWLTDEGMIMALLEGADSNKLLAQTKTLFPDAEVTHCFLEIIPLFDPEIMRMAYGYAKGKGKLEFTEVAQVILSGAAASMDMETGRKIALILKKYPKYYDALKTVVKEMINQLSQLIID